MNDSDTLSAGRDPFQDPSLLQSSAPSATDLAPDLDNVLIVGRDASLTLGTDSLIVLDAAIPPPRSALGTACGLLTSKTSTPPTRSIPYHNVLWASLNEFDLTIHHAHPVSKTVVRATCIAYPVDKSERTRTQAWVHTLLDRAYGQSQRQKRIKVLVNPFGGQGKGRKYWLRDIEPILAAAQCTIDAQETTHKGHAVEIAEQIDPDAYDVIASCSGDGLPHEVLNGLARKPDAVRALHRLAVVQLPCGSGNAMSLNLNGTDSPSLAALAIVKGLRTPLDLMAVTQGARRVLSFLSQSTGMVAATDLGTEHLRWMGDARFTYGFLTRLIAKAQYPCDVSWKLISESKPGIRARCRAHRAHPPSGPPPTPQSQGLPSLKYGTINDPLPASWSPLTPYNTLGTFYAGKMPFMARDATFFPAALPNDGALDVLMIDGSISRLKALGSLLAVGNGSLFDCDYARYAKVEAFRIVPRPGASAGHLGKWLARLCGRAARNQKPDGYISIDGERFPFAPFQVEIQPALGCTLSRAGSAYEAAPLE